MFKELKLWWDNTRLKRKKNALNQFIKCEGDFYYIIQETFCNIGVDCWWSYEKIAAHASLEELQKILKRFDTEEMEKRKKKKEKKMQKLINKGKC